MVPDQFLLLCLKESQYTQTNWRQLKKYAFAALETTSTMWATTSLISLQYPGQDTKKVRVVPNEEKCATSRKIARSSIRFLSGWSLFSLFQISTFSLKLITPDQFLTSCYPHNWIFLNCKEFPIHFSGLTQKRHRKCVNCLDKNSRIPTAPLCEFFQKITQTKY